MTEPDPADGEVYMIIKHIVLGARLIPDPICLVVGHDPTVEKLKRLMDADDENLYNAIQVVAPDEAAEAIYG